MSKFHLKFSVMAVALALLSACQHHQANQPAPIQPMVAYSLPEQAKSRLIQAMEAHLKGERYAVSVSRSQVAPLYDKDSPNKDADPIWGSIMKVREFQRNYDSEKEQPYRTESEYLGWHNIQVDESVPYDELDLDSPEGQLPYLRFDDEQNGTTIKTVTRKEAWFDEDYVGVRYDAHQLASSINTWVQDFDHYLQNSLFYEGKFNKATIKQTLSDLNTEQKSLKKSINNLQKSAKGYQVADLNDIEGCFGDYATGVREVLTSGTPSVKTLELIYRNYEMCASGRVLNKMLMPATYINQGSTKQHLEVVTLLAQCQRSTLGTQRTYRKLGQTYLSHEQTYQDSYLNYAKCASEALNLDSDNITDMDSARVELYPLRYILLDGELSSYYTSVDKYRGMTGWLQAYRDMKAKGDTLPKQESQTEDVGSFGRFGIYGSMMQSMLEYIKQSPEQLTAQNLYQHNNTTLTSLSYHNPATREAIALWSLDFESPTARQSAQLPIKLDFGSSVATADVSALLPVMALAVPKHAPLPQDIPNGLMYFKAPHELAQKIPSTVIYDAISRGITVAMRELDEEKFTPVAGQDDFATQVGASHTIKLQLSTKEMGQMYATIAKIVVADLSSYVDAHPEVYPDTKADKADRHKGIKKGDNQADKVKSLIKDFATFNMAHRSSDVGGFLQAVEGVLPIGLDMANYLYLDAQGKLIATKNIVNLQDEIHDYRLKNTTQTRYGKDVFEAHTLAGKFSQSFNEPAKVDGVAWIKSTYEDYKFKEQAKGVRALYEYEDDNVYGGGDDSHHANVSNACTTTADDIAKRANSDELRQMAEVFKQKECAIKESK